MTSSRSFVYGAKVVEFCSTRYSRERGDDHVHLGADSKQRR